MDQSVYTLGELAGCPHIHGVPVSYVMLVGNVNDFSEHTAATSQTLRASSTALCAPLTSQPWHTSLRMSLRHQWKRLPAQSMSQVPGLPL
eukprot:5553225-Amphidinium_carterae.2